MEFDVLVSVLLAGCAYRAWRKWSTILILDEQGVRWRVAMTRRTLGWDRIEGVQAPAGTASAPWALVETGTGVRHVLPFMPRALFVAFKERTRILPPEAGDRPGG